MILSRAALALSVFFALNHGLALAEGVTAEEKIKQLEARIEALEKKEEPSFSGAGFRIGAGATFILQGTKDANGTGQKHEDATDASYSADIEIEKEFSELNAKAFLHFEAGQGAGVEDELTLYSNVNRDADDDNNLRLSEAWYEQGLFEGAAVLTFGKLDPTAYFDNNEAANDETTQFLSRIFRNSPVIGFPDNSAGMSMAFSPLTWLEADYGIFDANSDWEDAGDNLFNIIQLNFKPQFFGLKGNYRLLAWHNDSYHTKWLDTSMDKEDNYGYGLSFDQKINECVTLFTRFGWQNPRVYNPANDFSLVRAWSAGLQLQGNYWGRDNDALGLAIGQAIASDKYKEADPARSAKNEAHLEAYYNFYVNEHLSISPNLELIWNPFGDDVAERRDTIAVYGIRTQVDF